jgi:hypothetical protein
MEFTNKLRERRRGVTRIFRSLQTGGNAEDGTFAGEDTISFGDNEDDQRFYSLSRHDAINSLRRTTLINLPAHHPLNNILH